MLLWFVGASVVLVWIVFQSPALDYRVVAAGSLLPLLDGVTGGPFVLHTLLASVVLLAAVMAATQRRRLVRRRWLGLPIGTFMHLVLDGAWARTDLFWWPFLGDDAFDGQLPEMARSLPVVLLLEAAGIASLLWLWRGFDLHDPGRRAELLRSGHLPRVEDSMLLVVRHGRTAHNADGRLLGRLDLPLDEVGETQARALAVRLSDGDRVARIVSSPLVRALATAGAIADEVGVDVEVDERWIELDYGAIDGARLAEVDPDLWRQWRADPNFAPAGGESLAALGARVRAACDDLRDDAADRDVVVVTHVSPIKAAVAWALAGGDELAWRLYVAPGSLTRIGIGPGGTVLRSFNEA